MLLRNGKRTRKSGLRSQVKQHKKPQIAGDFLLEHTISNTFPEIYPYLTRSDIGNLAHTNRFFNQLVQDEQMWRKRYEEDFGTLSCKSDAQAQYKAETCMRLLKERWNINHYRELISLLSLHKEKSWAVHYNYFVESYKVKDEESINDIISTFLETKNLKLAELLIYLCSKQVTKRLLKDSESLTKLKNILSEISDPKAKMLMCFADCLLFREKEVFITRQRLLSNFLSLLNPASTDIAECIENFNFVLKQLSHYYQAKLFDYRKEFTSGSTVLDVIAQMGKQIAAILKGTVFDWIKEQADRNNGLAQFYYAEYAYDNAIRKFSGEEMDDVMRSSFELARDYYIKAYRNDCYQAVASRSDGRFGGLYDLFSIGNGLLDKNLYQEMLLEATKHSNISALIVWAKQKLSEKWEDNINYIWYIQEAILSAPKSQEYQCQKEKLMKCLLSKIKTGCNGNLLLAASIIFFDQKGREETRKYYNSYMSHVSCPLIINQYLEAGSKLGFENKKHREIFEVLFKHYQKENEQSLYSGKRCS